MPGQAHKGLRGLACGLLLAAVVSGCGDGAARAAAAKNLKPIVLVTIDTLSADHVGTYGYFRDTSPHIDRLGEDGVVFANTVTTMATTTPSHVALFTGRYPLQTGVVANGKRFYVAQDNSRNHFLAELLQEAGYRTAAFVSAAPVLSVTGLDVGFDVYSERDRDAGERPSHETMDAALKWLDEEGDAPFFVWIHMFAPHWPYDPPAPYDASFTTGPDLIAFLEGAQDFPDPHNTDVHSMHNRYDGEVLYADAQVGRLTDKLKQMGVWDETTVVVTADHGESLGQHGQFGHGELAAEQIFVPLIIKFPAALGLNGRRHESLVSLIDVVPTLVSRLDLPIDPAVIATYEGGDAWNGTATREAVLAQRPMKQKRSKQSKLDRLAAAKAKAALPGNGGLTEAEMMKAEGRVNGPKGETQHFAVLSEGWKLSMTKSGGLWLHNLRTDRAERWEVSADHPERVKSMEVAMRDLILRLTADSGTMEVLDETAPEIVAELRALGYL